MADITMVNVSMVDVTMVDESIGHFPSVEEAAHAPSTVVEETLETRLAAMEQRLGARQDASLAAAEQRLGARIEASFLASEQRLAAILGTSDQRRADAIKAEFQKLV